LAGGLELEGGRLIVSTILCIEENPAVGATLESALKGMGHRPLLAGTLDEGLRVIGGESIDLIVSDHQMADGTGVDLLSTLKQQGYDIPVIVTSSFHSVEQAVISIRHGAVDYLTKPLRAEAVRIAVTNAIELDRMRRANEDFRREISSLRGARAIVGSSPALRAVMEVVESVAPTRATVLLEGESGTGKELFAHAIHDLSPRAREPFITVNCAALPEHLVESMLFGHERGAFTGATVRSQGAFERAHRGTLLLDEISEMRFDLQGKLLRAIQEQEFERVGGNQPIQVDVRIVATTNRELRTEVEAGRFRSDLYYRLHVVPIHTPPLRERLEDVPALVDHFLRVAAGQMGMKPPPVVTAEALAGLQRRAWPGNIRELANAVERAVILCRDGRLTSPSFGFVAEPGEGRRAGASSSDGEAGHPRLSPTPEEATLNLRLLERITIQRALVATHGHRARAAGILGISERTLRNKLRGVSAPARAEWKADSALPESLAVLPATLGREVVEVKLDPLAKTI
jgi:DNA-binding NtrC family response regulator